jgi:hypothetical protein
MSFINVDDSVIWLTAVSDANTPAQYLQYNGRVVGIPASAVTGQLANGYPGIIYGVPGRARNGAGGWEWVMGAVDEVVIAVDAMMPGGWQKPAARDAVVNIARAMLLAGITAADVQAACAAIINAVLLEKTA